MANKIDDITGNIHKEPVDYSKMKYVNEYKPASLWWDFLFPLVLAGLPTAAVFVICYFVL